jgi:DNA integrity scanning protein DisA with diadenylate cyclase activity/mannitol/fructose-specific phosphotransferase system IIA component (Ntr-type)
MRFDSLITQSRIIDIKSKDLRGAFSELIECFRIQESKTLSKKRMLTELIDREKTRTTYLGDGIAMPYAKINWTRHYGIAIGRCPDGLSHDSPSEYGKVRIILLLLVHEKARNYVRVLSDFAQAIREESIIDQLLSADTLKEFRQTVMDVLCGEISLPQMEYSRINRAIVKQAEKIAQVTQCTSLMVFGDTFSNSIFELGVDIKGMKKILLSPGKGDYMGSLPKFDTVIPLRSTSGTARLSQMRSAFIIGLGKGVFKADDMVCCVGGVPKSNLLDTIVVVDVDKEFQSLIPGKANVIPQGVQVEVLERVLTIATELSTEGREGKPIGALFVIGDSDSVMEHSQPLLLNPFYGYGEDERNVLNPFMDETIKELSCIDGAFVIKGNGVVESAGSLLRPLQYPQNLPSGLGSRHAAAAGITLSFKCIAIVVSSSTGHVSLFSGGDMITLTEKKIGGHF